MSSTTLVKPIPPNVLATMDSFLSMIQTGTGPLNAAVAAGWTIRQFRDLEANPQFQAAMAVALEQRIEGIEEKAYELARAGNVPMIQMILYSHASDKGWRPPAQRVAVHHGGTVKVEQVMATKAALRELMAENGVSALAFGGPLDPTDPEIVDAEVVDGTQ